MKIRSSRGVEVDMGALLSKNERARAVGAGAAMNARGDRIDKKGNVITSQEELVKEYYDASPNAVTKSVALNDLADEVMTPAQVLAQLEKNANQTEVKVEQPKRRKRKLTDTPD